MNFMHKMGYENAQNQYMSRTAHGTSDESWRAISKRYFTDMQMEAYAMCTAKEFIIQTERERETVCEMSTGIVHHVVHHTLNTVAKWKLKFRTCRSIHIQHPYRDLLSMTMHSTNCAVETRNERNRNFFVHRIFRSHSLSFISDS